MTLNNKQIFILKSKRIINFLKWALESRQRFCGHSKIFIRMIINFSWKKLDDVWKSHDYNLR